MIQGHVNNHEAIVELEIAANTGSQLLKLQATIDTGYNGQLTLPAEAISLLQLPFAGHRRGMLADGSIAILELYLAQVIWHDTIQEVLVTQTSGGSLIGMELLADCQLLIEVCENGIVRITQLNRAKP
jgi:clan AA aspartic protease